LNLAALWKLPVLFVCENNRYAMGTALEFTESETNISEKAAAYRITSHQVDGMDVVEVAEAAEKAAAAIRAGNGPVFLECLTYRFRAHSMFDAELYRDKAEVEEWKKRDPLLTFKNNLEAMGHWSDINLDELEAEVAAVIDEAVTFAENGTLESIDDLEKFVYSEEVTQ
jgi:TPP-dependent pyruvate/acetoin dehydrogenase alpha subunit